MKKSLNPEPFMARAIELSKRGFPAPNPHVGCVVVQAGEVVGEGFHDHAGGPHAEVVALNQAGGRARGAEVFISQEPCNHQGRTGPCSLALIQAGVRTVNFAVADPNPRAAGGAETLRAAGVEVRSGLLAKEAEAANEVFLTAMRLRRPYVCLKAASTLDGYIATSTLESKWITGEESRHEAHRLRAEMGAVLVGVNTVLQDNPQLTARIEGVVNQPLRIVLDPNGKLTGQEALFSGPGEAIHVVQTETSLGIPSMLVEAREGQFDLKSLLSHLWDRGCTSLLVEGGSRTLGSFIAAGLANRFELFVAPKLLGDGVSIASGSGLKSLSGGIELSFSPPRVVGTDVWLTGYVQNKQ